MQMSPSLFHIPQIENMNNFDDSYHYSPHLF